MTFSQVFQTMRLALAAVFLLLAAIQPGMSYPYGGSAEIVDVVAAGASAHAHGPINTREPDSQGRAQSCCDIQCVSGQGLLGGAFELAAPASSYCESSVAKDMRESIPAQLIRPPGTPADRS